MLQSRASTLLEQSKAFFLYEAAEPRLERSRAIEDVFSLWGWRAGASQFYRERKDIVFRDSSHDLVQLSFIN